MINTHVSKNRIFDNFITFASIVILYTTDYKLALLEITKYLH